MGTKVRCPECGHVSSAASAGDPCYGNPFDPMRAHRDSPAAYEALTSKNAPPDEEVRAAEKNSGGGTTTATRTRSKSTRTKSAARKR